MIRNERRMEVLSSFRRYARLGLHRTCLPPYETYARLWGVSRSEREALDLLAVYDTLRLLRYEHDDARRAVEAIFFDVTLQPRRRNDRTYAVRRYAMAHHYDERTVYRQLARAERLYLFLRYGNET